MRTNCAVKDAAVTDQPGSPAPRVPCNRYDFSNVLALQFKERHSANLNCELAFQRILHYFDNLIYKQSARLQSAHNSSYDEAYCEVLSKIFELAVEFDHRRLHFGAYIKLKLSAFVTWEALKRKRRHKERMVHLPNEELVMLADEEMLKLQEHSAYSEVRGSLSNYKEETADILFMRHVMDFTQAEIGEVLDVHQFTVGLRLRNAHEHMASSSSFNNGNGNGQH